MTKVKIKLIYGSYSEAFEREANKWLLANPTCEILDIQYRVDRGNYSACITYREKKED